MANVRKPKVFYIGNPDVSPLERVPMGTAVEVLRDLPNEKQRVRVKPGQGLIEQEFEAFREELMYL